MNSYISCGVVFDIIILFMGVAFVCGITWFASHRGYLKEKYFIALLAIVTYAAYAITSYDLKKEKPDCSPPSRMLYEPQISMCAVLASIGVTIALLALLVMVIVMLVTLNDIKKKLNLIHQKKDENPSD